MSDHPHTTPVKCLTDSRSHLICLTSVLWHQANNYSGIVESECAQQAQRYHDLGERSWECSASEGEGPNTHDTYALLEYDGENGDDDASDYKGTENEDLEDDDNDDEEDEDISSLIVEAADDDNIDDEYRYLMIQLQDDDVHPLSVMDPASSSNEPQHARETGSKSKGSEGKETGDGEEMSGDDIVALANFSSPTTLTLAATPEGEDHLEKDNFELPGPLFNTKRSIHVSKRPDSSRWNK